MLAKLFLFTLEDVGKTVWVITLMVAVLLFRAVGTVEEPIEVREMELLEEVLQTLEWVETR